MPKKRNLSRGGKAENRLYLILASLSPRRRTLLSSLGLPFKVIPSRVTEKRKTHESPRGLVRRLAILKARSVARKLTRRGKHCLVIGADTVVVLKGKIFGKPSSPRNAGKMLMELSGKTHRVYTGLAVVSSKRGKTKSGVEVSKVRVRKFSRDEALRIASKHLDKSGSYAFQDEEDAIAEKVEGDWQTVVGLPLNLLKKLMNSLKSEAFRP